MNEFTDPQIAAEFDRCAQDLPLEDPLDSPRTVSLRDILRAHFLIADFFLIEGGEGISQIGPMNMGLLESAAYRQIAGFGNVYKWNDDFQVCATLAFGLIKDHAFYDANKRTALLTLLYHLDKIGRWVTIKQRHLDDFVVDIAENNLGKYDEFRRIQKHSQDPEIEFVASFLRRHSRNIDKRDYSITYSELDKRLRERNFYLDNPHNNYIDVIAVRTRRRLFRSPVTEHSRVTQINFPGWKRLVGRNTVNKVRRATGLTSDNGYDSESFFRGSNAMPTLLADYSEPLRRLANR